MTFAITAYFSTYAIVLMLKTFAFTKMMLYRQSVFEFPPHITKWITLTLPNAFSLIRKVAGLLSYKLPFYTRQFVILLFFFALNSIGAVLFS